MMLFPALIRSPYSRKRCRPAAWFGMTASSSGALRAGAIGYLLKDTGSDSLCRAIRAAAAGQVQIELRAAARLMREVRAPDSPEHLAERETDVLRQLALGQSNKEIAGTLSIGEKTVKAHVSNILRKLGVPSRTQAALHAVRIGLVPFHSPEEAA